MDRNDKMKNTRTWIKGHYINSGKIDKNGKPVYKWIKGFWRIEKITERHKTRRQHQHTLKQKNFLDASYLKCNCGLAFRWNIMKLQYEEIQ